MKKHPRIKRILLILLAVVIAAIAGFLIYASDYYRADATATAYLKNDTTLQTQGSQIVLTPDTPSETALIFYPGAKVEATAYLPILEKIKDQCGINVILVKMPFNMAIFNVNAADGVMASHPGITNWYIGGHSMGGAMASSYAAGHKDKVKGLILLGAYIYGDYPAGRALTIYGSLNADLEKHMDYTENIVKIPGGNHAQFGNYGAQRGDADATISRGAQQAAAVDAIQTFIKR